MKTPKRKPIKKKWTFWIMLFLILVTAILIFLNIGNEQIEYGLLAGLVIGLIMTVLNWVTK